MWEDEFLKDLAPTEPKPKPVASKPPVVRLKLAVPRRDVRTASAPTSRLALKPASTTSRPAQTRALKTESRRKEDDACSASLGFDSKQSSIALSVFDQFLEDVPLASSDPYCLQRNTLCLSSEMVEQSSSGKLSSLESKDSVSRDSLGVTARVEKDEEKVKNASDTHLFHMLFSWHVCLGQVEPCALL